MGQVISVTSGKGGTGKTTICAGVASCLAAEGHRVLCIDADLGLRNLDISLGMQELAPITFADVLLGRYRLEDATPHPAIPNLFLLSSPVAERPETIRYQDFAALLVRARELFDFCLIDSPAGIGDGFHLACLFADRVLIIATPDPASLRDAAATADQLRLLEQEDLAMIVNRVTPGLFRSLDWTVDDMMDRTGLRLLGLIPEDKNVVRSAAENQPLILCTDRKAARACLHIARRLCGEHIPLSIR